MSYFQALWSQVKTYHQPRDIMLHCLFGIGTPGVASWLEFLDAVEHGPATFNPAAEIGAPLRRAILAFLFTLAPYLLYIFVRSNKDLYDKGRQEDFPTIATVDVAIDGELSRLSSPFRAAVGNAVAELSAAGDRYSPSLVEG